VSGVVIDAVTKLPVAGATVSIGNIEDRSIRLPRMVTDEDGRFVSTPSGCRHQTCPWPFSICTWRKPPTRKI
jgi:hypothetical protein